MTNANIEFDKTLHSSINSIDPVANFLLRNLYKNLASAASARPLTEEERGFIVQLEDAYGNSDNPERAVNELLDEVYEILKDRSTETEQIQDERLYSVLERIIFINAREEVFRHFFDDIEEVICSVLQLDYSKMSKGLEINQREVNIFNYASAALNMIVEKMKTSCVSAKVLDCITNNFGQVKVIVTDLDDQIRYINTFVEDIIDKSREDVIGMPIHSIAHIAESDQFGGVVSFAGKDTIYQLIRPIEEVEDYSELSEKVYLIK